MYKIYNGIFADKLFTENNDLINKSKMYEIEGRQLISLKKNYDTINTIVEIKTQIDSLKVDIDANTQIITEHEEGSELLSLFNSLYSSFNKFPLSSMQTEYTEAYNNALSRYNELSTEIADHKANIEELIDSIPSDMVDTNNPSLNDLKKLAEKIDEVYNRLQEIIEDS